MAEISVSTGLLTVAAVLLLAAVATAAFMLALYLGERGRRRDLAWLVGREIRKEPEPAKVSYTPDAETQAAQLMSAEQKEKLIADIMAETGRSYEEAEQEAERLLSAFYEIGMTY